MRIHSIFMRFYVIFVENPSFGGLSSAPAALRDLPKNTFFENNQRKSTEIIRNHRKCVKICTNVCYYVFLFVFYVFLVCFCVCLCVFMCVYVFLCVFICFYVILWNVIRFHASPEESATFHTSLLCSFMWFYAFLGPLQKDARRKTIQFGGIKMPRSLTATRLVTKRLILIILNSGDMWIPYITESLFPHKVRGIMCDNIRYYLFFPQPGLPEGVLTLSNKECLHVFRPSGSPASAGRFPQPPKLSKIQRETPQISGNA